MQTHIVLKPGANVHSTISTSAQYLTTPGYDVVGAIIMVEDADVRMRWDGTDPVSGPGGGILMIAGSVWEYEGRDGLAAMKFIREDTTDAHVSRIDVKGG